MIWLPRPRHVLPTAMGLLFAFALVRAEQQWRQCVKTDVVCFLSAPLYARDATATILSLQQLALLPADALSWLPDSLAGRWPAPQPDWTRMAAALTSVVMCWWMVGVIWERTRPRVGFLPAVNCIIYIASGATGFVLPMLLVTLTLGIPKSRLLAIALLVAPLIATDAARQAELEHYAHIPPPASCEPGVICIGWYPPPLPAGIEAARLGPWTALRYAACAALWHWALAAARRLPCPP